VVAIGGIDAANLAEVVAAGASMAAVISAIGAAPDPEAATAALAAGWCFLRDRARA
jgi:thiamine-phosphate pyrophosphorylase